MDFRLWMTLLLAMAVVAESSAMFAGPTSETMGYFHGTATCNDQVGDCIAKDEEMKMENEVSRRTLAQTQRLISYRAAVMKHHIPCHHRGQSYYDCDGMESSSY
ncbi:Protein RALF-like [Actinidia chinensis var. chinensis]|uniref:Protein RALF-like n=1 Tax=Actinidia chinensis var. chinensis TaxID=1590841 RepID=A0A2R6QA65_ACTCC|nr:Protein RALF-like [Actinidia chinensis var. chinensis]